MRKVKLKYICTSFSTSLARSQLSDTGKYPVFGASGIMGFLETYHSECPYLGIIKDGAGVGRINKYPAFSSLLGTLTYIVPNESIDIDWLKYAIMGLRLGDNIDKTTIPHIYFSEYGNLYVSEIPLPEQQKIASYLDRKCSQIDALIANAQKQIERLKAYKQSIITETVTKGLDKNALMKNSGVEWIGDIPESAELTKVSHLFTVILGKMVSPAKTKSDETLESYFCAANVHFDNLQYDELKTMWFDSNEKETYIVQKGDLLVVEGGAGAGGSHIVEKEISNCYIQNSVMIVRRKKHVSEKWLYYMLYMLVKNNYIDYVCNKATIPHFTKDKLNNTPVIFYNEKQMQIIIAYLDKKCSQIDRLISLKQQKIQKLQQYKKSLIYEYVTGKKEV